MILGSVLCHCPFLFYEQVKIIGKLVIVSLTEHYKMVPGNLKLKSLKLPA